MGFRISLVRASQSLAGSRERAHRIGDGRVSWLVVNHCVGFGLPLDNE